MKLRIFVVVWIIALGILHAPDCYAQVTGQAQAGRAPAGYEWIKCHDYVAQLLKPAGWRLTQAKSGSALSCYVTPELLSVSGPAGGTPGFETGLSLIMYPQNELRQKIRSADFAEKFAMTQVSQLQREGAVIEKRWSEVKHGLVIQGLRYTVPPRRTAAGLVPAKTAQRLILASDRVGAVFVFTFESPTARWAKEWERGAVLLKNVQLWSGDE